jgi:hypothetical protein
MPVSPSKVALTLNASKARINVTQSLVGDLIGVHTEANVNALYDVYVPVSELGSLQSVNLSESLAVSLRASKEDKTAEASSNAEGKESSQERTYAEDGGTFVDKQAMSFIELIMSAKDSPEVRTSELGGVVFALRHLMQQSGWEPTAAALPKGFIDTLVSLVATSGNNSNSGSRSGTAAPTGIMGSLVPGMLVVGADGGDISAAAPSSSSSSSHKPSSDACYLLTQIIQGGNFTLISTVLDCLLSHYSAKSHHVSAAAAGGGDSNGNSGTSPYLFSHPSPSSSSSSSSSSSFSAQSAMYHSLVSKAFHAYLRGRGSREVRILFYYCSSFFSRL